MMDRTLIGIFLVVGTALVVVHRVQSKQHDGVEAKTSPAAPKTASGGIVNEACLADKLRLSWPMRGTPGKDWVITHYVDHDKGTNKLRDYRGATGSDAITYDGHQGLDIEIANFRIMDQGVPVFAAADGVVEEIFDGSSDRNLHCSSDKWNFVKLRHREGVTIYGHLKRGSVSVKTGTRVTAGTRLGDIGSSGCSAYPHLHFEVRGCRGETIDPIGESLFSNMPEDVRSLRPAVMEIMLFQPSIDSILPLQDPGSSDRGRVSIRHSFSAGVTLSALKAGDVLTLEFLSPSRESLGVFFERKMTQFLPRSHWWGNFQVNLEGTWTLLIKVNGQTIGERTVIATQ